MKVTTLVTVAVLAGPLIGIPASGFAHSKTAPAQRGGDNKGGGGGSHAGGGGQSHGNSGGGQNRGGGNRGGGNSRTSQSHSSSPPAHAARDTVRTNNYVPRTSGSIPRTNQVRQNNPTVQRRQIRGNSPAVQAQRKFTRTSAGRVYDNGLVLHKGIAATTAWQHHYFPKGHYHVDFYRTSYVRGQCYVSPFGFFFGVCVPFIAAAECHLFPPSEVFIDIPVYSGVVCNGFNDAANGNLMNDPDINAEEPGLFNAIDDLNEAFQGGNIDGLATLVDPNTNVAVYLRGKYQYSLSGNDYLNLSRDAIASMHTVSYSLSYLHQRAPGVFSVGGRQVYTDQNGAAQTTWVSYVLQDISGQWTLTQIGTAPANYHRPVFVN